MEKINLKVVNMIDFIKIRNKIINNFIVNNSLTDARKYNKNLIN